MVESLVLSFLLVITGAIIHVVDSNQQIELQKIASSTSFTPEVNGNPDSGDKNAVTVDNKDFGKFFIEGIPTVCIVGAVLVYLTSLYFDHRRQSHKKSGMWQVTAIFLVLIGILIALTAWVAWKIS